MIIHKDIIQGTEAWDKIRYGKIGGTKSGGLFKDSDTLFYELLAEHTEPFEPNYDAFETPAMLRGHELEPQARHELGQYVGIEFNEVGWLQCENNPIVGISPDGISSDETVMCELKCLGGKKHVEIALMDGIHKDYLYQLVHYFTVNPKLETLYFAAYRPENQYRSLVVRTLKRDTILNVGTEKKMINCAVSDLVETSQAAAKIMKERIDEAINEMKF